MCCQDVFSMGSKKLLNISELGIEIDPKLILTKKHVKVAKVSIVNSILYDFVFSNYSKFLKKKDSYDFNSSGCVILIISFKIKSGRKDPNS